MFFNGLTDSLSADWGDRLVNTVASQSIKHLFTKSESVEVAVRCPSSKLLQGSIDSFKMSGRGLVIRKDFQVEEMSFETDAVALDFRSILNGHIRLKQPTCAVAQVTLSEAGINQAFKSELVKKRLQNISIAGLSDLSNGEPISFTDVELQLLPDNQVRIFANTNLPYGTVPVCLTATLAIAQRRRLCFQHPHFELDLVPESIRGVSHDLTASFAQLLNNMIDLSSFDLDGVTMRLNNLETQGQKLIFSGYAQIEHFPGTFSSNEIKPHHERKSSIYQSSRSASH